MYPSTSSCHRRRSCQRVGHLRMWASLLCDVALPPTVVPAMQACNIFLGHGIGGPALCRLLLARASPYIARNILSATRPLRATIFFSIQIYISKPHCIAFRFGNTTTSNAHE